MTYIMIRDVYWNHPVLLCWGLSLSLIQVMSVLCNCAHWFWGINIYCCYMFSHVAAFTSMKCDLCLFWLILTWKFAFLDIQYLLCFCFQASFAQYISFHLFTFSLWLVLTTRWVSCKPHSVGPCFLIYSITYVF